ncbi:dual specificity protein phosphatase 23-like [Diabrotica undecimpunctata]|uniref:dual specificity protein phosphatase 23-like n=1 Tax=Diabrotica undecimpunctata TaxID=50387 RepID=UPI003B639907
MAETVEDISSPWNFSWVSENQLACMACPPSVANLKYLYSEGIYHLISLSEETLPPINKQSSIEWTIIPIEEFEAPLLDDIIKFIDICSNCLLQNKALGVHCRQGRGRTGVMAACFLIKFRNLSPDRAIVNIRLQRPGSIETYEQERAVFKYYDYLLSTK